MDAASPDSDHLREAEASGRQPMLADTSSNLSGEIPPPLASLTSSITDHVYRNGRRYARYREGQYPLPNDEPEKERQDLLHHIYQQLFGGRLIFSPVQNPEFVLDIGCGTGIWAIDVADEHENAQVIGIDLSPIQPEMIPVNLRFEIDDAESDWVYDKDKFDLVHLQNMSGSIFDWPRLLAQAYRHLKPGGYIEAKEPEVSSYSDDSTIPDHSFLRQFEQLVLFASERRGQPLSAATRLQPMLHEAGFVDVQERPYKLPLNGWPRNKYLKNIGYYQNAQYLDALQPFALGYLVDALDWSRDQVEVFLVSLRRELSDRSIHAYNYVRVVTARKPWDGEVVPPLESLSLS